jgi:hypothetical protein
VRGKLEITVWESTKQNRAGKIKPTMIRYYIGGRPEIFEKRKRSDE